MVRLLVGILLLAVAGVAGDATHDTAYAVSSSEGFSDWYLLPAAGDGLSVRAGPGTTNGVSARASPKTSEVTVTYANFPPTSQAAFEYAVSILERQFTFSPEVLVSASWEDMGDGALASVRFGQALKDPVEDPNLPVAGAFYPRALATAIRGSRLDTNPDVEIRVNSNISWHTNVDVTPPVGTYDLTTVAIHELLQGYGFASGVRLRNDAIEINPTVFDTFVVGRDGVALHKLPPAQLAAAATSDEVFFSGSAAKVAAGGEAPRLYAPPLFRSGSSLSHLHEWYVDMTPTACLVPMQCRAGLSMIPDRSHLRS